MRTFEEINEDIRHAIANDNAEVLRVLASEMQTVGTARAEARSSDALGVVGFITDEYPSALQYMEQALVRYEQLRDRSGVARILSNIGNVYSSTGDNQAALEHYLQSLVVHEELGDRVGMALASNGLGVVYSQLGDYPRALEQFRRALALHEELDDRAGMALLTGNMGKVYFETGDYPAALDLLRQAMEQYTELNNLRGIARVTGNLGNVYVHTGDYMQALEQYRLALHLHEELGDRANVARVSGNIATVHVSTGDYLVGLELLQRALELHEALGNIDGVARVTGNIIDCFIQLDLLDEAATLLDRQAAMQVDNPVLRAHHHANRARIALRSEDVDTAQRYLTEALSIATEAGIRALSAEHHKMLRDLAQKRNDFAGYIEHNNEYQRITEEVRGKEATQRMTMMEAERKAEAIERERAKERALLYGALPESVAKRMLLGEQITGDHYDSATVLFLDIVGFTAISDKIPPGHVVHLLSQIFSALDDVCKRHGITKIKTIGDSYMAVAGVPDVQDDHVHRAVRAALDMLATLEALEITMPPSLGDTSWTAEIGDINVRIGLHCGPVTAGVIGTERLQYDVWGDTVNVASRMESSGEAGRIHVSRAVADALQGQEHTMACRIEERGEVEIKGKGSMVTYWVEGA